MDEKPKVNDVVNTTDCLEAIAAFKAAKNLFFVVAFIALLALQGIFWLNYLGYIEAKEPAAAVNVEKTASPETDKEVEVKPGLHIKDNSGDEVYIKEHAEKVVSDVTGGEKKETAAPETEVKPAASEEAGEDIAVAESENGLAKYMPNHAHAEIAIRVCNFVLIFSGIIYCLLLLMSIKVSLIGRLGGINHISRAFLLSLFALILLLPWQCLFEGVVLGAIYLPAELFSKWVLDGESTLVCKIMYFARFTGMWAVSVLLLLAAQIRSAKWSKTTLRRLGILR